MPDVLYLVLTVAFFAGCAGFVKLCDRIVGPDSEHGDPQGAGEAEPEPEPARSVSTALDGREHDGLASVGGAS